MNNLEVKVLILKLCRQKKQVKQKLEESQKFGWGNGRGFLSTISLRSFYQDRIEGIEEDLALLSEYDPVYKK
jgi:hypothetical protein